MNSLFACDNNLFIYKGRTDALVISNCTLLPLLGFEIAKQIEFQYFINLLKFEREIRKDSILKASISLNIVKNFLQ